MRGIVNSPEGTLENPLSRQRRDVTLPPYATHLHGWFMWYVRGYLRRHFHAIRLLKPSDGRLTVPDVADQPVLLYTNHPSWWDPSERIHRVVSPPQIHIPPPTGQRLQRASH